MYVVAYAQFACVELMLYTSEPQITHICAYVSVCTWTHIYSGTWGCNNSTKGHFGCLSAGFLFQSHVVTPYSQSYSTFLLGNRFVSHISLMHTMNYCVLFNKAMLFYYPLLKMTIVIKSGKAKNSSYTRNVAYHRQNPTRKNLSIKHACVMI